MTIAEKILRAKSDYDAVYAAGGGGENPLQYAKSLNSTYQNAVFPDGYELVLDIPNVDTFQSTFMYASGVKKVVLKGNAAQGSCGYTYAFRSPSIEVLDASEFYLKPTIATYAFNGASSLVTIRGEWDMSVCSDTNQMFAKCTALQDVRLKPNTLSLSLSFGVSSKLSNDSVQSIVDGLADLTGKDTQILTLNSSVVNRMTVEQIDAIGRKNWDVN